MHGCTKFGKVLMENKQGQKFNIVETHVQVVHETKLHQKVAIHGWLQFWNYFCEQSLNGMSFLAHTFQYENLLRNHAK